MAGLPWAVETSGGFQTNTHSRRAIKSAWTIFVACRALPTDREEHPAWVPQACSRRGATASEDGLGPGGPGGAFGRQGEESGNSSRTGTPPVQAAQANAFRYALLYRIPRNRTLVTDMLFYSLLANMETENSATSPPSTAASPALAKAALDGSSGGGEKGSK